MPSTLYDLNHKPPGVNDDLTPFNFYDYRQKIRPNYNNICSWTDKIKDLPFKGTTDFNPSAYVEANTQSTEIVNEREGNKNAYGYKHGRPWNGRQVFTPPPYESGSTPGFFETYNKPQTYTFMGE